MKIKESQKVSLAKLYCTDSVRYQEKLNELGIQESDISDYIDREIHRKEDIAEVDKKTVGNNSKDKNDSSIGQFFVYRMGGSPYQGTIPKTSRKSTNQIEVYILVDGDNYPLQNLSGVQNIVGESKYEVTIYVSRDDLASKYKSEVPFSVEFVSPGNQAVDNRINSEVKKIVKEKKYKKIAIISQDNGYLTTIKKLKNRYHLKDDDIILCDTIGAAK